MKQEFKINYSYYGGAEHISEIWKKYPKESIPYGEATMADIFFYINGKLIQSPKHPSYYATVNIYTILIPIPI